MKKKNKSKEELNAFDKEKKKGEKKYSIQSRPNTSGS